LGLLFWIPGVYLEWPADPWEHYARINEWSWLHTVGEHTAWAKSSYFLAYSLLGWIHPPTRQLFWLDFYYTGACLLLCWQYYRLARAVGLGERASFIFVLVQALTFGNNIFGFYRYYGISSSLFAQLGAIALIRVAIEFANQKFHVPRLKFQGTSAEISQEETKITENEETKEFLTTDVHGLSRIGNGAAPAVSTQSKLAQKFTKRTLLILARLCAFLRLKKIAQPTAHEGIACRQAPALASTLQEEAEVAEREGSGATRTVGSSYLLSPVSCLLRVALCAACLLALTAFNHVQGIGIAALGVAAVVVWRLIEWKRSMVFWLAAATLALSAAAILWWPRHPALDAAYRPAGWLTSWYGFDLFSPSSPPFDRSLQILGAFGAVNLVAGLLLLRRNHVAAWLTVTPLFALCLPFVVIPFANALAQRSVPEILTFHRLLLSIPAGLALICAIQWRANQSVSVKPKLGAPAAHEEIAGKQAHPALSSARRAIRFSAFPLFLLSLAALLLVPANGPSYNRFWQALMVSPDDLMMKPVVSAAESAASRLRGVEHFKWVATAAVASVFNAISPRSFPQSERVIGRPMTKSFNDAVAIALTSRPTLNTQTPTLTHDPLAADPSAWTILAWSPPEFVAGIKDFSASSTALRNPLGRRADVFTSALIPINPAQDYRVECSATQRIGTNATAYLAVAWYDQTGRLLESNIPAPDGAAYPAGWANGTYSYFGLVGTAAPTRWTTYRTSFGPDEAAEIPHRAKFVRVGALLNYNATPAATIQITNVRLWRKSATEIVADGAFSSDEHLFIVVPSNQMLWTCASQGGQASNHWPANKVAADLAGGAELAAAVRAAGGTPVDPENTVFELEGNASASIH